MTPFILTLFLVLSKSGSRPYPKVNWQQLTTEQRIAQRVDSGAMKQRLAAARSAPERTEEASFLLRKASDGREPADVVFGSRNPELFLPYEIFEHMAVGAFGDDAQVRSIMRESKEPMRVRFGLPEDFWQQLESLAAAYLADVREDRDVNSKRHPQDWTPTANRNRLTLARQTCRDRAAAMRNARRVFGPKFDDFLYSAIAPDMFVIALGQPNAERLRNLEGGCE